MDAPFINVYECDASGNCSELSMTLADVTNLKSELNLPISDMRMFMQHSSAQDGMPAILARPSSDCFLINLDHIKLICKKDTCMVLYADDKSVGLFVDDLKRHLGQTHQSMTINEFSNMHTILRAMTKKKEAKLEFAVMETVMETVTSAFKHHLNLLRPILELLLQETLSNPNTGMLRRMLAFMKNLTYFEMRVTNVRSAIEEILDNDEDLTGVCLNQNGRADLEEMILLLEAYSSDLKELECELTNIKEQIEDTNDFMNIHLNTIRNSFMKMSMVMEMGMLIIALGTLVAGFFGMNLPNGLEDEPSSFIFTCCLTVVGIAFVGLIFSVYVYRYTSLSKDFSSAVNVRAFSDFLLYAKEVEQSLLHTDKTETISKKGFQKVLEPVVGIKLKGHKLSTAFKVLFLDESKHHDKGETMSTVSDVSNEDEENIYVGGGPRNRSTVAFANVHNHI